MANGRSFVARVLRGLSRRCPRCGGRAFESWFRMAENCLRCGVRFEREEGYWVGAMIMNTTVTFLSFGLVFVGMVIATWPDVPWPAVLAASVGVNLLLPVIFYPVSKSLWFALELSWHPLEEGEIAEAAERAGA